MYKMLMKFFRFCGEKNRKKFYRSVVLGVLEALCSSMKIAAAYFAIKAVLEGDFSFGAFALVIGLMLISTIGKTIIEEKNDHYEVFADAADRGRI